MSPPTSSSYSPGRFIRALLEPLLLRPLVWMAWAAVAGIVLGGSWGQAFLNAPRETVIWWWPLGLALIGAIFSLITRKSPWKSRIAIVLCFIGIFGAYSFRRILAPADDISWQCALKNVQVRMEPLATTEGHIRGIVSDYPRTSEFSVAFPVQVEEWQGKAAHGNVWISAPYGTAAHIGDQITADVTLRPLKRPTNPGERATFWSQIGNSCWCEGRKVKNFALIQSEVAFPLERCIENLRRAIYQRFEKGFRRESTWQRPFPAQNAALLTAMVFGENGLPQPLPARLRDDFRAAGLSHLLVASGTQCTFVVLALIFIASRLGIRRWQLIVFVVPGLVFYSLLAGLAPSIWRAMILGLLAVWALASGRDIDGLSTWSAALIALFVLDPLTAWSLSTQLTFAATWGLLCLAPMFMRWLKSWGEGTLIQLTAFSLGAQLAVLPVTLFHFGTASPAGLSINFLAVPLAEILVLFGTLNLVLPLDGFSYHLTRAVGFIAKTGASLPGAQFNASPLKLVWAWLFYALMLFALLPLHEHWSEFKESIEKWLDSTWERLRNLNPLLVVIPLAVFVVGIIGWNYWPRPQTLRVTVFDVGQGESILIQTPEGNAALVDGGSLDASPRADIGAAILVPALFDMGVERLDYLLLTHADADHCNGLASLAHEVPIVQFVDGVSGARPTNGRPEAINDPTEVDYLRLRRELERQKVPSVIPKAGQVLPLGAARLEILAPTMPLFPDRNNNCLVFRLRWKNQSILFTGDMEAPEEERLLHSRVDLSSTLLKVGHHGSKTSSTLSFLKAVGAGAGLISCGRYNHFKHPNAETLQNLESQKMQVYRTDLDGSLSVECSEQGCTVTPTR